MWVADRWAAEKRLRTPFRSLHYITAHTLDSG